jgi:hypothetical protein
MSRAPNKIKTTKVHPSLSAPSISYLEELVGLGYGNSPTEVAAFLIRDGIDQRLQVGLIGPGLRRRVAEGDS